MKKVSSSPSSTQFRFVPILLHLALPDPDGITSIYNGDGKTFMQYLDIYGPVSDLTVSQGTHSYMAYSFNKDGSIWNIQNVNCAGLRSMHFEYEDGIWTNWLLKEDEKSRKLFRVDNSGKIVNTFFFEIYNDDHEMGCYSIRQVTKYEYDSQDRCIGYKLYDGSISEHPDQIVTASYGDDGRISKMTFWSCLSDTILKYEYRYFAFDSFKNWHYREQRCITPGHEEKVITRRMITYFDL